MIGIIGAMEIETAAIKAELVNPEERVISGVTFVKGLWQGKEVVVATAGVGKVFAAICAEAMILKYQPEWIVNTGVAGALSKDLRILDVVISQEVVQHDMDTSPLGDPVGLLSGINKVQLPADPGLVARFKEAADSLGVNALPGTVASGDQFVAEGAKKEWIVEQFGAACCEMEGASIGQVCYVNQVPFVVLRAISDGAQEEATMDYPAFAAKAAAQSVAILRKTLEDVQ